MKFLYAVIIALVCAATNANSTSLGTAFNGIFKPTGSSESGWSCREEDIGQDGGALAIRDGILDGLENRCELTDPQIVEAGGVRFTAVCSAEGNEYEKAITLSKTNNGIRLISNGSTSYWSRCEGPIKASVVSPIAHPTNSQWTFGGRQGIYESWTSDRNGNSVTFTCDDIGQNGGLYIELAGQPIAGGGVEIDIDGQSHGMVAWVDDGKSTPNVLPAKATTLRCGMRRRRGTR